MATKNIYNLATGQQGFQVPGQPAPAGWAFGIPPAAPAIIPGAGVVSGSSSVVSNEQATAAAAAKLTSTLPEIPKPDNTGLQNAHDASLSTINDYMKQLEDRRQQEIAGINAGFDVAKTNQDTAQNKETGSVSVGIARMGGYLGGSGSGTGVMLNLAQTHRDEITALEAKRQDAIRQANTAIDDKQFQLAQSKVAEAKSFESDIYSRNKDFWNQQIQLQQENRANDTALGNKYQDQLKAFSLVDPKSIDPAQKAAIDQYYGSPGFTDAYLKSTTDIQNIKNQKDAIAYQNDFISLLQKIPDGQKVTFPDGTTYTGIGSAGDISTLSSTDDKGVVRQFMINKLTGKVVGSVNLGAVGKASSASDTGDFKVSLTQVGDAFKSISESPNNPTPGRVSVGDYIDMYKTFIANNPGQGAKFLSEFQPAFYTGKTPTQIKLTTGVDVTATE